MIVISDIINNVKLLCLTGSIVAFINLVLLIVVISLLIHYVKHYRPKNAIIVENNEILTLFNMHVVSMQFIYSSIVYEWNMPTSKSFSHWSIGIKLENDAEIVISPSGINNIHVHTMQQFLEGGHKIHRQKYIKVISSRLTTLKSVAEYMLNKIMDTTYGYTSFNCQNIVYDTLKRFTNIRMHKPFKNSELLQEVINELTIF